MAHREALPFEAMIREEAKLCPHPLCLTRQLIRELTWSNIAVEV